MKEKPICKAAAYEPQRNLPQFNSRKGAENRFALQFAKAYQATFTALPGHGQGSLALAREIPANGYGIADLVSVTWKRRSRSRALTPRAVEVFVCEAEHTMRAFELKLSDWRKALQQASRYRFFAHMPIAVLPEAKSRAALENLEIFKRLGVGLWTFEPKSAVINTHYTPTPDEPRDPKHHMRALRLLAKATKALPVV